MRRLITAIGIYGFCPQIGIFMFLLLLPRGSITLFKCASSEYATYLLIANCMTVSTALASWSGRGVPVLPPNPGWFQPSTE